MKIGLPKEIKVKENRVALTPGGVATLVRRGHSVTVERGAGVGSGIADGEYEAAGATLGSAADAWAAEMDGTEEYFKQFGDKLPEAVKDQLAKFRERIAAAKKA